MLYDPKWQAPQSDKAKPSLAGLIAWLETQDPATAYHWASDDHLCLIEQYCASIGISRNAVHRPRKEDGSNIYHDLSTNNNTLSLHRPHTFGAALERAKFALAAK